MLRRVKACFAAVPECDARANIGPRTFLVSLIFAFTSNDHTRSLDAIRQSILSHTGISLARSSFWQRLSSKRLTTLLEQTVALMIKNLAPAGIGPLKELAENIGVKDILGYDASSTSLPDGASEDFPGPRKNIAPAAFKWHNCMSLVSGLLVWWTMTAAKVHDRKCFPPLKMLAGRLILFDLGYWDFGLLRDLGKAGAFFLSRIKSNAVIEIIEVKTGLNNKKYVGQDLLRCELPKKRKRKIIEVLGTFGGVGHEPITLRVIGFWNKKLGSYHWYTTNLTVPAKLIYPLYRLRWQLELAFKSSKASFRLADAPSANSNIIKSLLLANILAILIAFPLANCTTKDFNEEKRTSVSLQRSAKFLINIANEFRAFLIGRGKKVLSSLVDKIRLLAPELYDPNFQKRSSTGRQAIDLSKAQT